MKRAARLLGIGFGIWLGGMAATRAQAEEERNACGCYRGGAGTCYCDKKAKCGCPGDCEPKGCEEKRQKELDKEIEAETKKAQQAGKQPAGGESAAKPAKEKAPPKPPPTPRMSAAQKRELTKLLEAYLKEHPEGRGNTVDQVLKDASP
jgi:hypothetical protein